MSASTVPDELFHRIAEASGLAPVIAKGVIARCCARAGIEPARLTARDVSRIVPYMEPLLQLYLKPAEIPRRLVALRAIN